MGGLQIPGELGKAWDSGAQEIGACDQVVCGPVCHSGFGTKKAGFAVPWLRDLAQGVDLSASVCFTVRSKVPASKGCGQRWVTACEEAPPVPRGPSPIMSSGGP